MLTWLCDQCNRDSDVTKYRDLRFNKLFISQGCRANLKRCSNPIDSLNPIEKVPCHWNQHPLLLPRCLRYSVVGTMRSGTTGTSRLLVLRFHWRYLYSGVHPGRPTQERLCVLAPGSTAFALGNVDRSQRVASWAARAGRQPSR